ncbi:GTPase Era [Anaerotalea alkaliphila]|uniref:GTPase Era n=1 Tax=Anaerotalea alkaliphila TaxID=2662126 RepID=A0A7X5HWV7_9FIRM|nr:GTPase Era [Anaerotalea alkaliphila]NDL67976.1 GTPase Era [Anaerotalea alkaliphila]
MSQEFKSGFVSIVGRPNVGKSTLMNRMIGQKIAITSDKPQTTRNRIQTILTNETEQVVFLDTPGIHKPKSKLGAYMNTTAKTTFREVDMILWLVEPDKKVGPGDLFLVEQLKNVKIPVVLVINKMDTLPRDEILAVIAAFKDLMDFAEVIAISAITGQNTDMVMDAIRKYLPEGPKFFPDDMVTDQPEKQIVAELIREKVLRLMEDEIPHGVAVVIDQMREREDGSVMDIDATIICEKDSHKGMIIGKQGAMIKKIGTQARQEIEGLLDTKVYLQLWVKIKNNWRDSDFLLRNFGYDKNSMDE